MTRFYETVGATSYREAYRQLGGESILQYRETDKEAHKLYRKQFPSLKSEQNKLYKLKNPEKIKAHQKFHAALRSGRLTKSPCEECGEEKAQAHHGNYKEPLKVRWLCASHHKLVHLIVNKQ